MIKTKRNQKWKLPRTVLERRTLCSSSYKNHKLKVKLWWAGFLERKKRAFFVPFILSKGNFFNICVLSQCSMYVLSQCMFNTLSEYAYFYISKNITSYTYLLVFKIVESLPLFMREKWTQDKQVKSYVSSMEKGYIQNPKRIQSVTTFAKSPALLIAFLILCFKSQSKTALNHGV